MTRPIAPLPENNLLNMDKWSKGGAVNKTIALGGNLNGSISNMNTMNTISSNMSGINHINNMVNTGNTGYIGNINSHPINSTLHSVKKELIEKKTTLNNTTVNTKSTNSQGINNLSALLTNKSTNLSAFKKEISSNVAYITSVSPVDNINSVKQEVINSFAEMNPHESNDNKDPYANTSQDQFFDPKEELFDHTLPPEVMGGTPEYQKDDDNLDNLDMAMDNHNHIHIHQSYRQEKDPTNVKVEEIKNEFLNSGNYSNGCISKNFNKNINTDHDINMNSAAAIVTNTKISIPNMFLNDPSGLGIKKTTATAIKISAPNNNQIHFNKDINFVEVKSTSNGVNGHNNGNGNNSALTNKKKNKIIDDEEEEEDEEKAVKFESNKHEYNKFESGKYKPTPPSEEKFREASVAPTTQSYSSNKIKISLADVDILSPSEMSKSVKSAKSIEKESIYRAAELTKSDKKTRSINSSAAMCHNVIEIDKRKLNPNLKSLLEQKPITNPSTAMVNKAVVTDETKFKTSLLKEKSVSHNNTNSCSIPNPPRQPLVPKSTPKVTSKEATPSQQVHSSMPVPLMPYVHQDNFKLKDLLQDEIKKVEGNTLYVANVKTNIQTIQSKYGEFYKSIPIIII